MMDETAFIPPQNTLIITLICAVFSFVMIIHSFLKRLIEMIILSRQTLLTNVSKNSFFHPQLTYNKFTRN
jgi:hypothetical protein